MKYTIAPLQGILNAVSAVITTGDAGNEFPISLPFGVLTPAMVPVPEVSSVSTIVIGPPLIAAP